jgi:hypothetical protein
VRHLRGWGGVTRHAVGTLRGCATSVGGYDVLAPRRGVMTRAQGTIAEIGFRPVRSIDVPPRQSDVRGLAWAGLQAVIDVPDSLDPGHLWSTPFDHCP